MSAFIMSIDSIASLAEYIDTLNWLGFDYFGYSIPRSLNSALALGCGSGNEKKIFEALYALNVQAVNGRYKADNDTTVELPKRIEQIYHPKEPKHFDNEGHVFWIDDIKPWHYQLLKKLQCFIYQCEEDTTIDNPILKSLQELEQELCRYIAENNIEYEMAKWG